MGANICEWQPRAVCLVRSTDGKATLSGLAAEPNKQKILQAPVTVIIGHDVELYLQYWLRRSSFRVPAQSSPEF